MGVCDPYICSQVLVGAHLPCNGASTTSQNQLGSGVRGHTPLSLG